MSAHRSTLLFWISIALWFAIPKEIHGAINSPSQNNKVATESWHLITNSIIGIEDWQNAEIKEASYLVTGWPGTETVDRRVLAVRNPKTGNCWIGLKMDFYVDTGKEILGGVAGSDSLFLRPSAVSTKHLDLNGVIKEFDEQVDGKSLVSPLPGQINCNLRGVLGSKFCGGGSSGPRVVVNAVERWPGNLCFKIENAHNHQTQSAWISTRTWKPWDLVRRLSITVVTVCLFSFLYASYRYRHTYSRLSITGQGAMACALLSIAFVGAIVVFFFPQLWIGFLQDAHLIHYYYYH